jgi:hypothetical protein
MSGKCDRLQCQNSKNKAKLNLTVRDAVVDSNGHLGVSASSRRFKQAIARSPNRRHAKNCDRDAKIVEPQRVFANT